MKDREELRIDLRTAMLDDSDIEKEKAKERIVAEFNRLNKRVLGLEQENCNLEGAILDLNPQAEALERICRHAVKWTREILSSCYPHRDMSPADIQARLVLQEVCDYLDSTSTSSGQAQQKPREEYDYMCKPEKPKDEEMLDDGFGMECSPYCPDCGQKSMSIVRSGKVQCNVCGEAEERLRGILRSNLGYWCDQRMYHVSGEIMEDAITDILEGFKLR